MHAGGKKKTALTWQNALERNGELCKEDNCTPVVCVPDCFLHLVFFLLTCELISGARLQNSHQHSKRCWETENYYLLLRFCLLTGLWQSSGLAWKAQTISNPAVCLWKCTNFPWPSFEKEDFRPEVGAPSLLLKRVWAFVKAENARNLRWRGKIELYLL